MYQGQQQESEIGGDDHGVKDIKREEYFKAIIKGDCVQTALIRFMFTGVQHSLVNKCSKLLMKGSLNYYWINIENFHVIICSIGNSVQFSCSVESNSQPPHGLQHARPSLSITNSRSLLKLMSIESVMPSSHLILCCPLLLPPSVFPSIRVFSNESVLCIRWPKY